MIKQILILLMGLFMGSATVLAQAGNMPAADLILGVWSTEGKDAKFEIYKKDNQYFGKIIWGTGGDTKDSKNPDPKLRSRDLIGLSILKNFVFKGGNLWEEGTIYDPKNGETYSCKLTLVSSNKLDVRGFVGFSLFGRTETWTRIK